MADDITRRILVHGRVQGVGYRDAMADAARRVGVRGWVRNRADGTFEAIANGPSAAVESLIAWARRGPRAARVANVETFEATGTHVGFERRPGA